MDFLAQEIAGLKRKAQESDVPSSSASSSTGPAPKKYLKKGDLEKIRIAEEEAKERAEREEKDRKRREKEESAKRLGGKKSLLAFPPKPKSPLPPAPADIDSPLAAADSPFDPSTPTDYSNLESNKPEVFNISPLECIRRLRLKSQPIRLFGESDKDRRLRLRALELMEERGGAANPGLNDFKKALEEMEMGMNEKEEVRKAKQGGEAKEGGGKGDGHGMGMGEGGILDLGLLKTDPEKLYPLIYYALKRTLKDWEQTMNERPDSIQRSTQGMRAAAVQVQSADYLKPLFKSLRARTLPADVLGRLSEIVHHMQSRQYQRANDSYLRLSIGTAAWPIGVTMVGIHARSAREKISSDSVAHVLNDEVSRKYIQSVKRLLTFAQTKYPPADVSQLMG